MQKLIFPKTFSWLILVFMLTIMINGVHESAYAMQSHVTVASDQSSHPEISACHQCPCSPLEQSNDAGDCDSCDICPCHAPLEVQAFQLGYNPMLLDQNTFDPFQFLPEVHLPKFVPPQINA